MQKQLTKVHMILLAGLIGILGALLTAASDLVLLGRPDDAHSFFKIGTETMAGLSQWRITFGTFLGVFSLPMQIAGLITVYFGLKPAGNRLSLAVVLINAHALIMGVAFHVSYAFIGSGWKLYYEMGKENTTAPEMMKRFEYYWKIIIFTILAELLISSICFALIIFFKETHYPKWMFLLNPLCIFFFMYLMIFALPAPVGGYIAPAYLNLSTVVFMTLSTFTIYKKLKQLS